LAEHIHAGKHLFAQYLGCAEWLIGTIRRECVDHLIVFGEAHLRRIVKEYAAYYDGTQTHRAFRLSGIQSTDAITS